MDIEAVPRAVLEREKEILTFSPSDAVRPIVMSWEFSERTAELYVGLFGIPKEAFICV